MVRENQRTEEERRFRWWPPELPSTERPRVHRIHSPHRDGSSDDLGFLGRLTLFGVAAFLFATGFKVSGARSTSIGWIIVEMLLYVGAIGFLMGAVVVRHGWSARVQAVAAGAIGLALILSVSYEILVLNPNYGTDVLAFAHGGAEMLLDGRNPYEATPDDVAAIANRFGVSTTLTEGGEPIDWLISYPSLHVLTFTFFVGVEVTDLRWVVLLIELVALGVIWRFLSARARLIAPFVLLLEPYLSVVFTGGGVTDWLWVLPLVGTILALQRRRLGWAGLMLGLACAVKQHPWFAVPFVLVWVVQSLRRDGHRGRPLLKGIGYFAGALAIGFVLPNLPFFLWSPRGWLEGVLSPAISGLVDSGHGFVVLVERGVLDVDGSVQLLVLATTGILLAFLYARYFDRLQDTLWLMPLILIFLSPRALHSYFVFWIPLAVVWLDQVHGARFLRRDGSSLSEPLSDRPT